MSKKRPISQDERYWWLVLVDAEMFAAMYNTDKGEEGSGEKALLAHRVGAHARHILVTRFGANLDNLASRARDEYNSLVAKLEADDKAEKERTAAVMKVLDEVVR